MLYIYSISYTETLRPFVCMCLLCFHLLRLSFLRAWVNWRAICKHCTWLRSVGMLREKKKTAPSVGEALRKVDKRNDRSYYGIKIIVNLSTFVLVLRALVYVHMCIRMPQIAYIHTKIWKHRCASFQYLCANDRIYDVCNGYACVRQVIWLVTHIWPHHTYFLMCSALFILIAKFMYESSQVYFTFYFFYCFHVPSHWFLLHSFLLLCTYSIIDFNLKPMIEIHSKLNVQYLQRKVHKN